MDRRTAQILAAGWMCLVKETGETSENGRELVESLNKESFGKLGNVVAGYAVEILGNFMTGGEDTTKEDLDTAAAYLIKEFNKQAH